MPCSLIVLFGLFLSLIPIDEAFCQASALPGSNVMISPTGGGFLAPRTLLSADLGACATNNFVFFNNGGNIGCEAVTSLGGGTVTSLSFTGGIISIANPTTTPSFTVAGTSGGIPYFNSSVGWASSGVLAAGSLLTGGGAGAAPATVTLGGDCTFSTPNITCTKTGGVAFGALATSAQATALSNISWTGGIVSIATPTSTPAFTVAGTSGGIPYFSGASTWASSAALANHGLVVGGGAGAAPATLASLGTATTVLHGAAAANPSFGSVVSADTAFTTQAATDNTTSPATTAWYVNQKKFASLQSFGAVGDGTTDDTAAVQTALNSGVAIVCNGFFKINGLVTITNAYVSMSGGKSSTCHFDFTSTNSMFYFTENAHQYITLDGFDIQVKAAITAVTGPSQTAAFFLNYSSSANGLTKPQVKVNNVNITNDGVSGHYILQGIYCFNCGPTYIQNFAFDGDTGFQGVHSTSQSGIVYTGNSPQALLTIENFETNFQYKGIYLPQTATNTWQGIRVDKYDCVFCGYGIDAQGDATALSDQLFVTHTEGLFTIVAINAINVLHAIATNNYWFMGPTTGIANIAFPVCYNFGWTQAITTNGAENNISNNSCDGGAAVGYTARYAVNLNGFSNQNMVSVAGPNTATSVEYGTAIEAGAAGWTVYKGSVKNATVAELVNVATAGANTIVPPLAVIDGSYKAAGLVGEIKSVVVPSGSAVALTSGAASDVGTLLLPAGEWLCFGQIGFTPAGATTVSLFAGSTSLVANSLPSNAAANTGMFFQSQTFTTGIGAAFNVGTVDFNTNTPLTVHLVALSNFAVSTMAAFGDLQCKRQ